MKKTLIILIPLLFLLLVLISGIFISGKNITVARCIVTDDGELYMAYHDQPVRLVGTSSKGYKTGDKLFIIHDIAFAESYPAQTRTLLTLKIESGDENDISEKVLNVLRKLGY
jgi:hypothetical protein